MVRNAPYVHSISSIGVQAPSSTRTQREAFWFIEIALSFCWYLWLTQEAIFVKSAQCTRVKHLAIVGELEAVKLSDDEEESIDEKNQTKSKRSSTDSGLPLAQRRRADSKEQRKFERSDKNDSENDDFLAALLHDGVGKRRTKRRRCLLPWETTSRRPKTTNVKTIPGATMARGLKATSRMRHQRPQGAGSGERGAGRTPTKRVVKEKRQTAATIENSDIWTLAGKTCHESEEDCWIPSHRSQDSRLSCGHW